MNGISEISSSFASTLKDSDLQGVTANLTEVAIDSLLDDNLLKDIPIVGTIIGLTKTGIALSDRLFLKKIIHFISELKDVEQVKRNQLISEIDNSTKHKLKVGEKLLYIIDKCNDHQAAEYTAEIFKALLIKKIDYSEFLCFSEILNNTFINYFQWLITTKKVYIERKYSKYETRIEARDQNLINSGLLYLETRKKRYPKRSWDTIDQLRSIDSEEFALRLTKPGLMIKEIFTNHETTID